MRSFVVAGLLTTLRVMPLGPTWGAETERPNVFLDTTYVPSTGWTVAVPAGGDFQATLTEAQPKV